MSSKLSAVVTIRVPPALGRSIEREGRRRGRTKSEVVREILEDALGHRESLADPAQEARRQSLLVSARASEREALAFIERVADQRGWK